MYNDDYTKISGLGQSDYENEDLFKVDEVDDPIKSSFNDSTYSFYGQGENNLDQNLDLNENLFNNYDYNSFLDNHTEDIEELEKTQIIPPIPQDSNFEQFDHSSFEDSSEDSVYGPYNTMEDLMNDIFKSDSLTEKVEDVNSDYADDKQYPLEHSESNDELTGQNFEEEAQTYPPEFIIPKDTMVEISQEQNFDVEDSPSLEYSESNDELTGQNFEEEAQTYPPEFIIPKDTMVETSQEQNFDVEDSPSLEHSESNDELTGQNFEEEAQTYPSEFIIPKDTMVETSQEQNFDVEDSPSLEYSESNDELEVSQEEDIREAYIPDFAELDVDSDDELEELSDDSDAAIDKIEILDTPIEELNRLTEYEKDNIEATDINSLFDKVSVNFQEASDIFRKNTEMKKKIDIRFDELKKLQSEVENAKRLQIEEVNAYKDEVFNKLTEKKAEIEKRLNILKEAQAKFDREKHEFELYKKDEVENIEQIKKQVQEAYDERREELNHVEDILRKQKDALDEERSQLSLDKIQYEADKNDLANNLLKFNELVGNFTTGVSSIPKE